MTEDQPDHKDWQQALKPSMLQHLYRPVTQPGVIAGALSRRLAAQAQFGQRQLPLLATLRHGTTGSSGATLPLVYARRPPVTEASVVSVARPQPALTPAAPPAAQPAAHVAVTARPVRSAPEERAARAAPNQPPGVTRPVARPLATPAAVPPVQLRHAAPGQNATRGAAASLPPATASRPAPPARSAVERAPPDRRAVGPAAAPLERKHLDAAAARTADLPGRQRPVVQPQRAALPVLRAASVTTKPRAAHGLPVITPAAPGGASALTAAARPALPLVQPQRARPLGPLARPAARPASGSPASAARPPAARAAASAVPRLPAAGDAPTTALAPPAAPPAAPAVIQRAAAPGPSAFAGGNDDEIVERVLRRLARRLAIEGERRGTRA